MFTDLIPVGDLVGDIDALDIPAFFKPFIPNLLISPELVTYMSKLIDCLIHVCIGLCFNKHLEARSAFKCLGGSQQKLQICVLPGS